MNSTHDRHTYNTENGKYSISNHNNDYEPASARLYKITGQLSEATKVKKKFGKAKEYSKLKEEKQLLK